MKDVFTSQNSNPVIREVAIQTYGASILSEGELVETILNTEGADREGIDSQLCSASGSEQAANKVDTGAVAVVGRAERDDGGGHGGSGGGSEGSEGGALLGDSGGGGCGYGCDGSGGGGVRGLRDKSGG